MIIEISRALCILSKYLRLVPRESVGLIFSVGLSYITSNIDHFVDNVRNYVKLFFSELVSVAAKYKQTGDNGDNAKKNYIKYNIFRLSRNGGYFNG